MDRRHFLGAIAAVIATAVTLRHAEAQVKETGTSKEPTSPDLANADLPAAKAEEAQYYSNRRRRRRPRGYRVNRRRAVYGRRRANYGRRRSTYVRRRNAIRRSVRRSFR